MKKGTKIAIIVGIIVIAIVAIFVAMIVKDLKQEEILDNELNELFTSISNFPLNYDEIDAKLNQTVTTGSYYELEKSVKAYVADVVSSFKELDNLLDDKAISNVLSASNLKEDGPNFTKTNQYLKEAKETLAKVSSDIDTYFTEEKAMTYIESKQLDNYEVELYKKYTVNSGDNALEQDRKEIKDTLNQLKSLFDKQQEIIDFLTKNKRSWEMEKDSLVFYSQSLSNQYNKLVEELNAI